MNQNLITLAQQNVAALHTLSRFLHASGTWPKDREIESDTSSAIYELFEEMAWSDRNLHAMEYQLLDSILEEDAYSGGALLDRVGDIGSSERESPQTPGCLLAAIAHDSKHETQFRRVVVNHLENLGFLILISDARLDDSERKTFESHFARLRSFGSFDSEEAVR